jgi:hypothetical protein
MKISVQSVDWKENFPAKTVKAAFDIVGGEQHMYDYVQDCVNTKIAIFSSDELTDIELDQLWDAGDLCLSDVVFWEGDSIESVITEVEEYVKSQDEYRHER